MVSTTVSDRPKAARCARSISSLSAVACSALGDRSDLDGGDRGREVDEVVIEWPGSESWRTMVCGASRGLSE